MHEIHFLEDLFKDILHHLSQHNAKNVTQVFLELGEFTEINEECLRFFFKEKSQGSALENALFSIKHIPQQRVLRLVSFDYD
ncbi:MAG: hydrogenase/urease maturation nickel metallochaperone HypA [Candidatus Omnitrophica bacterium]|nr:hydrogenase/urease maturation nickel metallochaperone HypA [Candidatus Omnitrophota bacterium]